MSPAFVITLLLKQCGKIILLKSYLQSNFYNNNCIGALSSLIMASMYKGELKGDQYAMPECHTHLQCRWVTCLKVFYTSTNAFLFAWVSLMLSCQFVLNISVALLWHTIQFEPVFTLQAAFHCCRLVLFFLLSMIFLTYFGFSSYKCLESVMSA